jgi:hypothetical protein
VAAGAVTVALLGFSIWTLLAGIVVGVAVIVGARWLWPAATSTPPAPTPTAPA